jgi:hypothetical protein
MEGVIMPTVAPPPGHARFQNARRADDRRGDRAKRSYPKSGSRQGARSTTADHPILFQQFFKSVGPRTYAAQMKRASNGNHYLVFTEGQRVQDSPDIRKTRLFVYSEDFVEFFRLVKAAAEFV